MQRKGAGQEGMQEQLLSCHWGVVQRLEKSAGVQDELFSRATQPQSRAVKRPYRAHGMCRRNGCVMFAGLRTFFFSDCFCHWDKQHFELWLS